MVKWLAGILILSFLLGGRTPEQKALDREKFLAWKWEFREKWGQIVWPIRFGLVLAIIYFVFMM